MPYIINSLTYSLEDTFPFGKYKGEQIEDVIEDDPSYLEWVVENDVFNLDEDVIKVLEKKKII